MLRLTLFGEAFLLLFVHVYAAMDNSYFKTYVEDFRDLYCPAPDAAREAVDSISVCGQRCSGDAECLGFFYNTDTRSCDPRATDVSSSDGCQAESGTLYWVKTVCASTMALVSGPFGIADGNIMASSQYPTSPIVDTYAPYNARLDNPTGWTPADPPAPPAWIQWATTITVQNKAHALKFDLTTEKTVVSITTQGFAEEYVMTYQVLYSTTLVNFATVKDAAGNDQTFVGNAGEGKITNTFATPIVARCIRVYPITSYQYATLRMELYGC